MKYFAYKRKLLIAALSVGSALLVTALILLGLQIVEAAGPAKEADIPDPAPKYIVMAWNDLGMHCYNRSFQDLAVLPPYNTLWAQVIQMGDPPTVVTDNIKVEYSFADNTYSVGKTNFWDYEEALFGVKLDPNVGLAGFSLTGTMQVEGDHFAAIGIPLTEFGDGSPTTPMPYQVATIVVKDSSSNLELTRLTVVAPVSTEMHCDNCHYDRGPGNSDIATGVVEQNILTKHDQENLSEYPVGHEGALMSRRPVLCAECHSSNALSSPGAGDVPSLSNAMHEQHDGIVPDTLDGCYNCHPGPTTRCLRDVMSTNFGMQCIDCHGTMLHVSRNSDPWKIEPRCDNGVCHGASFALDQPLYRNSKGHGNVYCAGCHDSPHAIAPSRVPLDGIKFSQLQNNIGPIASCTVCHLTEPTGSGPHGMPAISFDKIFLPITRAH